TTEHAVEYVIVALFCWGLMDVLMKVVAFPKESLALRQDWLPQRHGREPVENAQILLERVRSQPQWMQDSKVGKRLIAALSFVTEKGTADDYREHVQYLADLDDENSHSSYGLIRFVAGVSPVLGFLGTVIHFGTALSGISFDDLVERLPGVVSEMGSAFNTTTCALAAAMTMMFALFVCERIERGIVHAIDRLIERELLNRFEIKDPSILPFLSVVQSANQEALASIGATLKGQIEIWGRTLDALFQRFDQRQQHELQSWQAALDVLQQRHEAYDNNLEERLHQSLVMVDDKQEQHLLLIQTTVEKAVAVRDDFVGLARSLETIARGEGKLAETQAVLSDNLRVLRETQQIDEALHGLTAAIHLLTGRHGFPGTRGAAAA
ncbi:MAG: MotA/TolQ/ExbB proton channel family protein, partial [Planctomycetaceae bacterium]|nr:MotA/TolQ/ExbB proton channel family protein [Planctomycetaceae bacterium]